MTGQPESYQVIIVGSGSAGLTAALHAAKHGASRVLILEKSDVVGGNSLKASTGVSAALDRGDVQAFKKDILASGRGLSVEGLVDTLVNNSESAVAWLRHDIGVAFDDERVRMGGHSVARTWTFQRGAVGVEIIKKLHEAVENDSRISVKTGARVTSLLKEGGRVVGCEADSGTGRLSKFRASKGVVLTTGGFGHHFGMLARYMNNRTALCTTNGPFATGDGIGLGEAVGAHGIQLDQIQVHPTGFVDPLDPDASTKILAPEKLRGLGGILVDGRGRRFVSELATRREISDAMNTLEGREARLLIDDSIAAKFGPGMGFYKAKGLVWPVTLDELKVGLRAEDAKALEGTLKGAGFDVGRLAMARVTPVVHYTMGGLAMDEKGAALDRAGKAVQGLFVAGEVAGGVHGANRLGGCSLLDCIVFGTIAGTQIMTSS